MAKEFCDLILPNTSFDLHTKRTITKVSVGDDTNNYKVYCLVNENTMSSAELVAGLIKGYDNGKVIGESSTYGKNTVQKAFKIDNYTLKITIGKFILKSEGDIECQGLRPSVYVPRFLDDNFETLKLKRDICLNEESTEIYALKKIISKILDEKIKLNGILDNYTLKKVETILNKNIEDVITASEMSNIYKIYIEHCYGFQNDRQIKYIKGEVYDDEKSY